MQTEAGGLHHASGTFHFPEDQSHRRASGTLRLGVEVSTPSQSHLTLRVSALQTLTVQLPLPRISGSPPSAHPGSPLLLYHLLPTLESCPHSCPGFAGSATKHLLLPIVFITPSVGSGGLGPPVHSPLGSATSERLLSGYSGKHGGVIDKDDRHEERRTRENSLAEQAALHSLSPSDVQPLPCPETILCQQSVATPAWMP